MRLSEIMTTKVVTIGSGETASAAWTRMRRRDIRHLVVVDGTGLVGVISERDLGGRAGAGLRKNRRVRDLMTPRVASAEPDTTLRDAADLMRERLIGSLPVVAGDQLVGIVTATDVFEALGEQVTGSLSRAEQQLLRPPTTSKRLGGRPVARRRSDATSEKPRRRPDSPPGEENREPLATSMPRAAKRAAGRTAASEVPANIRVVGVQLDDDDRAYIRLRLGARLGKYAPSIERVTVRVRDVNGPRGGADQVCNIKVVLSGLPSVVFESHAVSLKVAVNAALTGVERTVRRALERVRPAANEGAPAAVEGGDETGEEPDLDE